MYTSHGHHIPGTSHAGDVPETVARCMAFRGCQVCLKEQAEAREKASNSNPIEPIRTSQHVSVDQLVQIRMAHDYFAKVGVSPAGRWEMIAIFIRDGIPFEEVIGK